MPRLAEAMQSLSEIHAHLARGEVYQGITARPVLLSGILGLVAASIQNQLLPEVDARLFIYYWLTVAAACAVAGIAPVAFTYLTVDDSLARRRTRIVAGQFIPCLIAGATVTLALLPVISQMVGLLPGIWSVLYGLGLFSTRPYLPRATGWVALYFVLVGSLLIALMPVASVPSPWIVALIFAGGQAGLASVLHRNKLRENNLG